MGRTSTVYGAAWLDSCDRRPVSVLSGEVDRAVAAPITDEAIAAHCAGRPLTVDLTAVTFLDSFGLSLLLRFRQFARSVRLVGASEFVAGLIRTTGLTSIFDF